MDDSRTSGYSRRAFLAGVSAIGAAAGLGWPLGAEAEPPPETKKIRLINFPAICLAPQYLAEELLRMEGFSDVEYVESLVNTGVGAKADMWMDASPALLYALDGGSPLVALAGVHAGCYELFGNDRVRAVRDLKGKSVSVSAIGATEYVFVASMAAYVGIDPLKDIQWIVAGSSTDAMRLFAEGSADAFLAFEPEPHELRAKKIGHVILNTTQDRPWSQYFCCMLTARREFVRKYPIAARRALRAILKATDICAQDPERAARYVVNKGFTSSYDIALKVLKSLPYLRWREGSPEDTLRFHALRLHEGGIIKTNPNKLIAQGTDWRILDKLKKEMKA